MKKFLLILVLISLFLAPMLNAQLQTSSKITEISPTEVIETKTCPVSCTCTKDVVACPVEVSCIPPCVESGDTCTCPALPTKVCKVSCVCEDDTMECPVEQPICDPPCIQSGDTCSCPIAPPTRICPVGCICESETTTCPTTETFVSTGIIATEFGIKVVSIEKTQNELSIKTENAVAITTEKLVIEQDKLSLKTSAGDKEIKILPEEASSRATAVTKVNTIELKEESQQPIYSVKGTKQAKLLFVIPVSMQIETKVNAESGNVISVEKPWWSFLAW